MIDRSSPPAAQAYLLGRIDFQSCLELQDRLVRQATERDDGQIVLLVCEHPPVVTIGRGGSPDQVASENRLLQTRQIEVHWVSRGGGCLMHCPGQLAIYPILPLAWHGMSLGQYIERLRAAVAATLEEQGVRLQPSPDGWGLWGRTGQLAALGVAMRRWVTLHGAFLNVCPPLGLFRLVAAGSPHEVMSSLEAERCGRIRMPAVRAGLVQKVAEAFGCDRYHLHTGHPWLRRVQVKAKTGSLKD